MRQEGSQIIMRQEDIQNQWQEVQTAPDDMSFWLGYGSNNIEVMKAVMSFTSLLLLR